MSLFRVLVPIREEMNHRKDTVFEHTPLDYYRCGKYPRFTRPVGAQRPQAEVVWVEANSFDEAISTASKKARTA